MAAGRILSLAPVFCIILTSHELGRMKKPECLPEESTGISRNEIISGLVRKTALTYELYAKSYI